MLSYGCTRIEIGVQSVYESIARETNRGHTVSAVSHSFHLAKDCGFKVVSHLMPDLPNTGYERDLLGFQEYFENPAFRSDGVKLYPTLVIRGTGLYELWKTGRYQNYTPQQLIELTAQILSLVPPWTRLYRIQRDIPMPLVSSGVEHGNLRELALAHLREHLNVPCLDIRSREVGMKQIHANVTPDQVELLRRDYSANGGWETFLSYEDPKQDVSALVCSSCPPRESRLHCFSPACTFSILLSYHLDFNWYAASTKTLFCGVGTRADEGSVLDGARTTCLRNGCGCLCSGSNTLSASRFWHFTYGGS